MELSSCSAGQAALHPQPQAAAITTRWRMELVSIAEPCLQPHAGSQALHRLHEKRVPQHLVYGGKKAKKQLVPPQVSCSVFRKASPIFLQPPPRLYLPPLKYLSLELSVDTASKQRPSIPKRWRAVFHAALLIILCI